jgi:hypothetical protein
MLRLGRDRGHPCRDAGRAFDGLGEPPRRRLAGGKKSRGIGLKVDVNLSGNARAAAGRSGVGRARRARAKTRREQRVRGHVRGAAPPGLRRRRPSARPPNAAPSHPPDGVRAGRLAFGSAASTSGARRQAGATGRGGGRGPPHAARATCHASRGDGSEAAVRWVRASPRGAARVGTGHGRGPAG